MVHMTNFAISSVVFKMQISSSISIFIVIVRNSQPSKEVSGGNGENLILSVICYTSIWDPLPQLSTNRG